jgi:hypothetical protein
LQLPFGYLLKNEISSFAFILKWDAGTGRELCQGGTVVMRADSAYYSAAFCGPVRRVGARFSVMVQIDPKIDPKIAATG